jgi:hypothetical protein
MSIPLTRSISNIPLFDLVDDDDDVDVLARQLDEQPHLINIRDEVS